jgi:hypothetical protein
MKPIAYCLFVVSGLITLTWPVAAFVSIFVFDAPIRGIFDGLGRFGLVTLLLTYPWGLVVAVIKILARKKGTDWCTESTIMLLMAPIIQISLLLILMFIIDTFSR